MTVTYSQESKLKIHKFFPSIKFDFARSRNRKVFDAHETDSLSLARLSHEAYLEGSDILLDGFLLPSRRVPHLPEIRHGKGISYDNESFQGL